jgi:metallophosphoesterase superfamily enzyme
VLHKPQAASRIVELAPQISAVAPGMLWMEASRSLVAADVHLAYEDAIGAALPSWSTFELVRVLLTAAKSLGAREIVLLGDVIHSSRLSEGAAREVQQCLAALRAATQLAIVAGNHEGKTRGVAVLGETVEFLERQNWLLLHGDRGPGAAALSAVKGCIIGHLHPSLPLASNVSAPAFLAARHLLVLPALTPYSSGLNVFSDACLKALHPFNVGSRAELSIVAAAGGALYPFGSLSNLSSRSRIR